MYQEQLKQLEQLNELKEKGIISEEEFVSQKQKLFAADTGKAVKQKEEINWKNVGISLLIALGILVLEGVISVFLDGVVQGIMSEADIAMDEITYLILDDATSFLLNVILACVLLALAPKYEMRKYKGTLPSWAIVVACVFLGPVAAWIFFYHALQIKAGLKTLKPESEVK